VASIQNNLGNAYADLPTGDRAANLQQAIHCYQEALKIEHLAPWDQAGYLHNLGDAHRRLEDYPAAIAAYDQALELNPEDAAARNRRGLAHLYSGHPARAVEDFTQMLELNPEDATAHYNTACTHALMGNVDEACRWLGKTIELDERYREMARDDEDFDGIRDDELFQALMAVKP
jgi:tetratricopeptide (TPR) repeat protein